MSSHGAQETERLKANIQDQLSRLLLQLQCVAARAVGRQGRRHATRTRWQRGHHDDGRARTHTADDAHVVGRCCALLPTTLPPTPHTSPTPPPPHRRDLEDLRHELEDDEYDETRKDTLEQMEEFDGQLKRLMDGDMTLVSELGQVKLALRAAISNAFQTPDVIRSFARREPAALRERLRQLAQDWKLGRSGEGAYRTAAVEVVVALQRLGEELTPEERATLDSASADVRKRFETAEAGLSETAVLALAAKSAGGGRG